MNQNKNMFNELKPLSLGFLWLIECILTKENFNDPRFISPNVVCSQHTRYGTFVNELYIDLIAHEIRTTHRTTNTTEKSQLRI